MCTVWCLLAKLGYSNHGTVKKPTLTLGHTVNRVQFAKKYRVWDEEKWLPVLWSDGSTFMGTCNSNNIIKEITTKHFTNLT